MVAIASFNVRQLLSVRFQIDLQIVHGFRNFDLYTRCAKIRVVSRRVPLDLAVADDPVCRHLYAVLPQQRAVTALVARKREGPILADFSRRRPTIRRHKLYTPARERLTIDRDSPGYGHARGVAIRTPTGDNHAANQQQPAALM